MNLIEEYIELTKNCASTVYADKKSVGQQNKSVDRMYEIVGGIGDEQNKEAIDDFSKLLDITENKTNLWAAIHLLERIPVDKKVEEKALSIIQDVANGDTAESFGYRMWLDDYIENRETIR